MCWQTIGHILDLVQNIATSNKNKYMMLHLISSSKYTKSHLSLTWATCQNILEDMRIPCVKT